MPIKLTKNGVDSLFSGSEKNSKRREKKIKHATKEPFSSLSLQKKTFRLWDKNYLKVMKVI